MPSRQDYHNIGDSGQLREGQDWSDGNRKVLLFFFSLHAGVCWAAEFDEML